MNNFGVNLVFWCFCGKKSICHQSTKAQNPTKKIICIMSIKNKFTFTSMPAKKNKIISISPSASREQASKRASEQVI